MGRPPQRRRGTQRRHREGPADCGIYFSKTIPARRTTPTETLTPIHPGEVLREEFLQPLSLNVASLAQSLGVAEQKVSDVLAEKQNITTELALRLAQFFGTSAHFWLGLQAAYDLDTTRERLGRRLEQEIVPLAA